MRDVDQDEPHLRRIAILLFGDAWETPFAARLGLSNERLQDLLSGHHARESRQLLIEACELLSVHERECWRLGYEIRERLSKTRSQP